MVDRVCKILGEILNVPRNLINQETSVENLEQWDSLAHVTIVFALEEAFGIRFSDEEIVEMISVQAICEHLRAHCVA